MMRNETDMAAGMCKAKSNKASGSACNPASGLSVRSKGNVHKLVIGGKKYVMTKPVGKN